MRQGVSPLQGEVKRDGGIEMRARQRPEDRDQHHQRGARRQRIGQQRHGDISARQPLGHDARAHHGDQQKRGAEGFRDQPPAHWSLAMSATFFCSERRSRPDIFRLAKALMRLFSMR